MIGFIGLATSVLLPRLPHFSKIGAFAWRNLYHAAYCKKTDLKQGIHGILSCSPFSNAHVKVFYSKNLQAALLTLSRKDLIINPKIESGVMTSVVAELPSTSIQSCGGPVQCLRSAEIEDFRGMQVMKNAAPAAPKRSDLPYQAI